LLLPALAPLGLTSAAFGQTPLTFDSLAAIAAPPPEHRVAYGPEPLQFGHLRLPRGPGPHPVVLFVHGGCYLSQYNISHAAPLEQAFADSGYAVWSIEYRRVGDEGGGWPNTFLDVGRAADYLRTLATQYPLDLGRVVAAGHSAGANFALWLATRQRLRRDSPLWVERPLRIDAVLGLAPAPVLASLHAQGVCNRVIDKLMGGPPDGVPERYGDVSPAQLIPIGVPQLLVVGTLDRGWGPAGREYYALARSAQDSMVGMVEAPDAGHFDVVAPTTSTWAIVMRSLRDVFARIRTRVPDMGARVHIKYFAA
jgi:acetyl esterase/lipase